MPDWLVSVLIQYPIVVVVGFVAWYAYRELKGALNDQLKDAKDGHARELANLRAANADRLAEKDAEVARLRDQTRRDIDRLVRAVNELKKRLDP